jgi:hypothetical protein
MAAYKIPIFFEPFERQKKAARLLHLLAGFLMIANAWGDYKQPTPDLLFVVIQVAGALLAVLFAFFGKRLFPNRGMTNSLFRLMEALVFFYAARYFFSELNLTLMGTLQLIAAIGLLLLFFNERKIFADCFVQINDKGITLPSNLKDRLIAWNDVENMRIRNDFISINTKQNQFIQFETGVVLSELQMDEMNAWCIEQFTKKDPAGNT